MDQQQKECSYCKNKKVMTEFISDAGHECKMCKRCRYIKRSTRCEHCNKYNCRECETGQFKGKGPRVKYHIEHKGDIIRV
jgi:hypothetical protein